MYLHCWGRGKSRSHRQCVCIAGGGRQGCVGEAVTVSVSALLREGEESQSPSVYGREGSLSKYLRRVSSGALLFLK